MKKLLFLLLALSIANGAALYADEANRIGVLQKMEEALAKKYDSLIKEFNEKANPDAKFKTHVEQRLANIEKRFSEIWKEKLAILEREAAAKEAAAAERARQAMTEAEASKSKIQKEIEEIRARLRPTQTTVSKEPIKAEFTFSDKNNYELRYKKVKGQAMTPVKKTVSAKEAQRLHELFRSNQADADGNFVQELIIKEVPK